MDGLQQRGSTPHVKWRASYTLAVFDDIFAQAGTQAILQLSTSSPSHLETTRRHARQEKAPARSLRLNICLRRLCRIGALVLFVPEYVSDLPSTEPEMAKNGPADEQPRS